MTKKIDIFNASPPTSFIATFESELIPIDGQKAKARLRIFYTGFNRNNTIITQEFVEKLLLTLPGTPVVGEYDKEKEDFTQHVGVERTRSYGFVPPEMNFAWEEHLDPDGETRTYACCDVVLWTGRYAEAKEIVGKKQSMELDPDSIVGTWKVHGGLPYFTYEEAEFFGLCVLGEDYNPCFEGSSFYVLENDTRELIKDLRDEYAQNLKSFIQNDYEGGKRMNDVRTLNFRLSHDQIFSQIWDLVNPNYTEEGGWLYENSVSNVYDDYALIYNYEEASYYRVYYTKDDTTDTLSLGEKVKVFVVDVTEDEYMALKYIQEIGSYVDAKEKLELVAAYTEKNPDFKFELDVEEDAEEENEEEGEEVDESNEFSEEEKDDTVFSNTEENKDEPTVEKYSVEEVEALKQELAVLKDYKEAQELAIKQEIIAQYAEQLDAEIIDTFTEDKLKEMTVKELEQELAYLYVKATNFIVSKKEIRVPNGQETKSSIVSLLENYVTD